jgi:NitT/TauT family transport system substrate-binding protein
MRLSHVLSCSAAALLLSATGALALDRINFLSANERTASIYPQQVAQELGFFAAEGLEVNFLSSATTVPYIAFLSNSDADLVMLDSAQVFQAVNAQQPISVIYEVMQFAPEGIAVKADSDIKGLADLKGKTVGLASDRDQITTMIALDSIGGSIDDITTVVVGDQGPILAKSMTDGTIQAYAGGSNDLAAIEANGVSIRNITPAEVSQNPGNSIVIWNPRKEELDDRVKRFLRAWSMANMAAVLDIKAVASIMKKTVPEQWENMTVGMRLMENATYRTNLRRTKEIGEPQPDVWAKVQAPYIKLGEIGGQLDPATFLDSSYIEAANDFTTAQVKEALAKWREANKDIIVP